MRLSPTPELLIALACIVLVLCAAAWWTFADTSTVNLGPPTIQGDPVVAMRASVPVIGDFARDYCTNEADPFVPKLQRELQTKLIRDDIAGPPNRGPRHKPPNVTPQPPIPPITWPTMADNQPPHPVCVGWVETSDGSCLLAHLSSGASAATQMHIGDTIGVDHEHLWTLLSISDDGLATFRDPTGRDEVFPIGGGQTEAAADGESDPTKSGTSGGNSGGTPARKPGTAGPAPNAPQGGGQPQQRRPRPRPSPAVVAPTNQGGGNQGGAKRGPYFPPVPQPASGK